MIQCVRCKKEVELRSAVYGLHPDCFQAWFCVDPAESFTQVVRRTNNNVDPHGLSPASQRWNSSFFHGQFLKYGAKLGGCSYILKLREEIAPEMPAVEYVSNQIAETLGLAVPDFFFIDFYGTPAFVTRNLLDKHKDITSLHHIYHYVQSGSEFNCDTLIGIISKQTGRYEDVLHFIRICLFDGLIGNHDRHGRNLAFLTSRHDTHLSPAYDNTSALGLESGDILKARFNPRGKIGTNKTQEPTMHDYAEELIRLGYRQEVEAFFKKISLDNIQSLVLESRCSELMQNALLALIRERQKELYHALYD